MITTRCTWIPRIAAVCAIIITCGIASPASATILLTELVEPNRNNFTGTVGIRFVPNKFLIVTALGFQDAGENGLVTSHEVGIWDAVSPESSSPLLASAVIQSGTASTLVGDWRYETITPILLIPGNDYFLAGFVGSGDGDLWTDAHPAAGVSVSADAAITQDAFRSGSFGPLTTDGGGNNARWGPANMQYAVVVPEPGTYVLGLLGLTGLGLFRLGPVGWRKRSRG